MKIYLHKKALFIFVNNVTFFSMLYHGAVQICCKYMDLCIHDCEMSGQLRASESFFSYFRVEIVGPIFLSFLKENKPDFSMLSLTSIT